MFINKNVNEIDQFQNIFTDSLQEEDIDEMELDLSLAELHENETED